MSHTKSARKKIQEQEVEIQRLTTSLTILEARTSHLHVRLLETLNTLDYIQSVHSEELETLTREKSELEKKLRMIQLQLDQATDERDDMRDAVERLAEKVELANGFHFLSHSAMHTHQLLEPRPTNHRESSRPGISSLYMPAVIKTLTADLAEEKKSHKKTHKDAESQIALLRAQVAHRETELETYLLTGSNIPPNAGEHARPLPHLTKDDALLILGQADERNRALQKDVEELGRQLEEARLETSSSCSSSEIATPGSPYGADLMGATEVQPPSPILDIKTDQATISIPSTPIGHSTTGRRSPSDDVFSNNPLPPLQPDACAQPRIPSVFLPETPPVPQRISTRPPQSQPITSPLQRVFSDIDNQISTATMDVEELRTEREYLDLAGGYSASTRETISMAEMEPVWLLEEECIRLQASNRDALQDATRATVREAELREVIRNLEERLRRHNYHGLRGREPNSSEFDSDGGSIGGASYSRRETTYQYRGDTSTDDDDDGYRTSETVSESQEPGAPHANVTKDLEPSSDDDVSESWVSQVEHASDLRTVNLEETLRLAREEIDRKDKELRRLRAAMERVATRNSQQDDELSSRPPLFSRRTN